MPSDDRIFDSVVDLIGHTPLLRLKRISSAGGAELCGKLESKNPGGSVKDRPALAMLLAAERSGELHPGATIIEATSGNTGISLAMVSAVRGYRCVLVMPEDMSLSRRQLLRLYGAELVLTPAEAGMAGAVQRAEELLQQTPDAIIPRQFDNAANPEVHYRSTAEEIWRDTGGRIDAFVAGVGTGGTLTGVARLLKERQPKVRVVAVEPRGSAVLSGGQPGLHGIQGLGAGFIPTVLDQELVDQVIAVSDPAAMQMQQRLAREEGLLVGPSAGANVYAAWQVAQELHRHQRVVTILCDTGERYLC